jgi:hypothetical protein
MHILPLRAFVRLTRVRIGHPGAGRSLLAMIRGISDPNSLESANLPPALQKLLYPVLERASQTCDSPLQFCHRCIAHDSGRQPLTPFPPPQYRAVDLRITRPKHHCDVNTIATFRDYSWRHIRSISSSGRALDDASYKTLRSPLRASNDAGVIILALTTTSAKEIVTTRIYLATLGRACCDGSVGPLLRSSKGLTGSSMS